MSLQNRSSSLPDHPHVDAVAARGPVDRDAHLRIGIHAESYPFCAKPKRAKGIEPSSMAWKATALPLSYARAPSARPDDSGAPPGVRGARPGAPRTPDRASYGDPQAAVSPAGRTPGKIGRNACAGRRPPRARTGTRTTAPPCRRTISVPVRTRVPAERVGLQVEGVAHQIPAPGRAPRSQADRRDAVHRQAVDAERARPVLDRRRDGSRGRELARLQAAACQAAEDVTEAPARRGVAHHALAGDDPRAPAGVIARTRSELVGELRRRPDLRNQPVVAQCPELLVDATQIAARRCDGGGRREHERRRDGAQHDRAASPRPAPLRLASGGTYERPFEPREAADLAARHSAAPWKRALRRRMPREAC